MITYPVSFVSLPIGNRDDITRRALQVLGEVDVIACEDTRHTGLLLSHYEISKPLLSMHEHNENVRAPEIAARALAGETFAVVTDAGMPGVSDPGYRLIQELKAREVPFTVLPGPSAVMTALVGSGLPSDAFFFGGFLPVKSGRRAAMLQKALEASHTGIFYESPFRIVKTVQALAEIDPEAPICVARELTKVFETYHRGKASDLLEEFKAKPPKGEIVLLVGGTNAPRQNG
ncbi:16S rRNA (cytidine(1402)-2'-O)-methyltransferase [Akkermansia glycaniphila]|uniref:Ribosomal RNA small subunit methyltransferase I n=1 Tax=Akkermansia glycaniphila TaxID=1679444 RepID=A0A1C7PIC0_9BACT|nr:16S rRNA (cytidine(1402)-2'-O)-methyltransferase [Akkermansia glycaniphila]MBT9450904.1 16S rRNA (cytidine(1402)-2'-O)-methyltransferase [Akkermansia glycaniphila]OCA03842.1 tetrapyrrole methylase [Akkermansia glycaniphila]SEH69208.1 tigr00096: 16s rrna (cytidine(1402)-2'-o)-methyltransferase [Akkermansia glycaniphila]